MIDATHRSIAKIRVQEVDRQPGSVEFVLGGETFHAEPVLFDTVFEKLPEVAGSITYSCGCPHTPDVEVEREWVMHAVENGWKLRQAANHFLPNYDERYPAFIQAGKVMVKEGLLTSNPFLL
jgi:hypothetical protein